MYNNLLMLPYKLRYPNMYLSTSMNTKLIIRSIVLGMVLLMVSSFPAFAKLGVGVGSSKIQVDNSIMPGVIYVLPALTVFNTGDEPSDYKVNVSYHESQKELMPDKSWFIFSPQNFHIEPGQSQVVDIKLNVPIRAKPGNYFAYLEGQPLVTNTEGNTQVGIAAAAKLYFTIVPAGPLQALYFKLVSFWYVYEPWPKVAFIILILAGIGFIIKHYFKIEVNIKKPPSN